jgi:hypothetical protein
VPSVAPGERPLPVVAFWLLPPFPLFSVRPLSRFIGMALHYPLRPGRIVAMTRWRLGAVLVAAALTMAACGGGGDDEETIALEPIVALDPCDLVDPETAEELVGAAVEQADVDPADGGVGCGYSVDGGALGGAVADVGAAIFIEPLGGDAGAAMDGVMPDDAEISDVDIGDGGRIGRTRDRIVTVYVVQEALVRIEVQPRDGVDDEVADAVVAVAETTVDPVAADLTGENAAPDGPCDLLDQARAESILGAGNDVVEVASEDERSCLYNTLVDASGSLNGGNLSLTINDFPLQQPGPDDEALDIGDYGVLIVTADSLVRVGVSLGERSFELQFTQSSNNPELTTDNVQEPLQQLAEEIAAELG